LRKCDLFLFAQYDKLLKMNRTIFNTPIISAFFHYYARFLMRIYGWRIEGRLPDIPKFVLIGAPHTSNWDAILFLGVVFSLRADVHVMAKAEAFRFPVRRLFQYFGGIPVDRSKSTGLVDQMVKVFNESEKFILTIAPEGTRHQVVEWKRGFYYIAKGAGLPIVLAVVDGRHKIVRIGQLFYPTEDAEADLKAIQGYFAGATGIKPRRKYITIEN
jgi:1-acyl-sn-glycerol-3-phosphate acyltransferase